MKRLEKPSLKLLLAILIASIAGGGAYAEPPTEEGELSISESARSMTGHFDLEDSTVVFEALRSTEGRVNVSVKANGQPFDLTFDPTTATIHLDGHNGRVFAKGRKAFAALSRVLEKRWDPYDSPISLEQHLTFRAILFLSEAPAGHVLEESTLKVPSFPSNVQLPPALEKEYHEQSDEEPAPPGPSSEQVTTTGCEVDGGDGISLLSCLPSSGPAWHDACFLHGFISLTEVLGCSFQTDCLGRCGAGCGISGAGVYSQDCADHDSCCGVHGGCTDPSDDLCGDEFSDATDDFLLGSPNCSGCEPADLPPPPDPDPCGAEFEETSTFLLDDSNRTPRRMQGLEYELSRVEERGDGWFLMGEWALVELGRGTIDTSSESFGDAAADWVAGDLGTESTEDGDGWVLVVEAAVHPRNDRWIPMPSVEPLEVTVQGTVPSAPLELGFRLEVSESGSVDTIEVFDPSAGVEDTDLVEVLARELTPKFVDQRRHRLVIFARAVLHPDGRLETSDLLVTRPMCCCGTDEPHCV